MVVVKLGKYHGPKFELFESLPCRDPEGKTGDGESKGGIFTRQISLYISIRDHSLIQAEAARLKQPVGKTVYGWLRAKLDELAANK